MTPNKIIVGDWVEVLKGLPAGSVQCCINSPPYWGQRNYGVEGQLGLEKTPEEHIEKLVVGFREVRRVLRDDGCVFLNYGDKYGGGKRKDFDKSLISNSGIRQSSAGLQRHSPSWAKDGDLLGLAWRLAFALQADGWYLRSDIIWAKGLSFCETYSGSCMPESVNGWRWEQHKVKIKSADICFGEQKRHDNDILAIRGRMQTPERTAQWADCPGCKKCLPNDGLVLRRGSWRPTRAHEYLFLLAKSPDYYCDAEAVREEVCESTIQRDKYSRILENDGPWAVRHDHETISNSAGRNLRDVWCINPQPYPQAHYATFPEKLVEPCIKVGTSEKGCCPKCGAPWARVVEKALSIERDSTYDGKHKGQDNQFSHKRIQMFTKAGREAGLPHDNTTIPTTTLGWRPTCECGAQETVPCVVLDPFAGSGTTCAVAARLGRNYIGIELNETYVNDQAIPRVAEAETGITVAEQAAGQGRLF